MIKTMKFDEAIKYLHDQSMRGAETWYGKQLENHIRTIGHLEYGNVEMVLYQLKDEYEPKEQTECRYCNPEYPSMDYQKFNYCPHCGRKLGDE
jgi:hypothetical protein